MDSCTSLIAITEGHMTARAATCGSIIRRQAGGGRSSVQFLLQTPNDYFGNSGLSVDRQNPNIVMVTGYSSWWPDTQIWRSVNGGASWSRIWDWTRYPNRSFRYVQNVSDAPWLEYPARPVCGGD